MKPAPPETVPLAPFGPIVVIDRASPAPLHRQIYQGFREAIVERRLRAGQRLPSSRGLARELEVSRMPVLIAFEQLLAEGYFETRIGAGTFVAGTLPGEGFARGVAGRSASDVRSAAGPPVPGPSDGSSPGGGTVALGSHPAPRPTACMPDTLRAPRHEPWNGGRGAFRVSQPALDRFPFKIWSRLVARHGRSARAGFLTYGPSLGDASFRATVAAYLRTSRGVRCEAEQVMAVSGSQHALALAARVLLDPGSRVWIEEPGYSGARDALALAGAQLVPVPVDGEGLDVAAGIRSAPRARAVYVTPSHQYPLGATMSASRRLQLLDWARESGAWVLEDDYDSEYRFRGLPIAALQGLDRDARVLYIGTFSKVLFPALRLGYLVIPTDLVPRFAAVRAAMDDFPATLAQAVVQDFILEGHFARHLRRMRAVYRERRDTLVAALDAELGGAVRVLHDEAGMHLVAALPGHARDVDVALEAAARGLWAMPLSTCYMSAAPPLSGLVLGYGSTGHEAIREGVQKLRDVVSARGVGARSVGTL
jgi:GntR family transcriptional regulator/MocR family aminotransferase